MEEQRFCEEEYLSDMPIDDAFDFDFDFEDKKTQLSQINFSSEKIHVRARLLSPMYLHQRFGSQELITIIRTQLMIESIDLWNTEGNDEEETFSEKLELVRALDLLERCFS